VKILEAIEISKSFEIPDARRETVRDHFLAALRRRRWERLTVLDRVSFSVERGETFGVMGRNGCGKSTLLKIVSGIFQPDRGEMRRAAPITPVLELGVGWNPELDAVDNILLIGTVMGLSLREAKAAVPEILAFAELDRFARLELKHYSSGMAARLGYAVAFRAVREVLLLDEIFAVGDAGFRARCEARYRELSAAGRTVVLVSHAPHLVEKFCDRAILLDGGRVVLEGTGVEVAQAYLKLMAAPASSSEAA
jgi:ABC-2 type transport system ATP-binding protein